MADVGWLMDLRNYGFTEAHNATGTGSWHPCHSFNRFPLFNIYFPISSFVTAYANYQPQGFQYRDMLIYLPLL